MARGATSWSKRLKAQKRASETIKRWHWSMETKSFTYTYEKYDCIESRAINCPRTWVVDWNVRTWDFTKGPNSTGFRSWVLPSHTTRKKEERWWPSAFFSCLLRERWTGRRAAKDRWMRLRQSIELSTRVHYSTTKQQKRWSREQPSDPR